MGFFDSFFGAVNNANPLHQGASLAKWVIGGILILVIFMVVWITIMSKSNLTPGPKNAIKSRLYGVIQRW